MCVDPRFQRQAGFILDDWEPFRAAMRDILQQAPRTCEEISKALGDSAIPGSLAFAALSMGSDVLHKPLHWRGDISFEPNREGQTTFRPCRGGHGLPEPLAVEDLEADVIGPRVVGDYVRAYPPATRDNLGYWLSEGISVPARRVSRRLATYINAVGELEKASSEACVLPEDLDAMREARASVVVRLIPRSDPWFLGAGYRRFSDHRPAESLGIAKTLSRGTTL